MFSTPALVPLDHDACVTPAVQRMTHGAMECPRPPAHPGARIILHHHEHNQRPCAHDEWHTPAPAPKKVLSDADRFSDRVRKPLFSITNSLEATG